MIGEGDGFLIIIDLINNLALLVALSVLSIFVGKHCRRRWLEDVLQGLLFGGVAVIGMLRPFVLEPGVFFDGRSVMVSLCALFFGPVAVGLAGALTVACRVWQGGAGQLMGVAVIVAYGAWGLLFRARQKPQGTDVSAGQLWTFGLCVHVTMALLMFTLPGNLAFVVLGKVALPMFLVYPFATVLVGKILSDAAT
jgi:LytS/YehU family sensor histidine kinase